LQWVAVAEAAVVILHRRSSQQVLVDRAVADIITYQIYILVLQAMVIQAQVNRVILEVVLHHMHHQVAVAPAVQVMVQMAIQVVVRAVAQVALAAQVPLQVLLFITQVAVAVADIVTIQMEERVEMVAVARVALLNLLIQSQVRQILEVVVEDRAKHVVALLEMVQTAVLVL
jgi:hypothetical protein